MGIRQSAFSGQLSAFLKKNGMSHFKVVAIYFAKIKHLSYSTLAWEIGKLIFQKRGWTRDQNHTLGVHYNNVYNWCYYYNKYPKTFGRKRLGQVLFKILANRVAKYA
jgi:hypothetical protein